MTAVYLYVWENPTYGVVDMNRLPSSLSGTPGVESA